MSTVMSLPRYAVRKYPALLSGSSVELNVNMSVPTTNGHLPIGYRCVVIHWVEPLGNRE